VLLAGLAGLFYLYAQHQAWLKQEADARETRLQAETDLHHLNQALQTIPFLLAKPDAEPGQLAEGIALCRKHADQFGVLKEPNWQQSPRVQALSEAQRDELRQDMGELLWFWARAETWKVFFPPATDKQRKQVDFALTLNTLAINCYDQEQVPPSLFRQRCKLLELSNKSGEALLLMSKANIPPRSPREHYLELCEKVGNGEWQQALPFLQKATRKGPGNSATWLVLAVCHVGLGELAEAKACFDHGIALDPDSPWAWFNLGVLHLMQENIAEARTDFNQALKLRENMVEALMNRAVAQLKLNQPQAAVDDLTQALELKAPYTRIYFMRARAKIVLKDMNGAKNDQDMGFSLQPTDEQSWVARGVAQLQLKKDAKAALADFEQALKLNPKSLDAWQNKALILAEYLKQPKEAIQALDKAIAFHPHFALAWAGRGVLLARQGKRTEAHRDAVKALALSQKPDLCYQVAGIYALTSNTHPDDRKEALRLLHKALSQDKRLLNLIPVDPDLDPMRQHPDFQALIKLANKLQQ
jgi:tetratricopeptide (TPR) repeat protein